MLGPRINAGGRIGRADLGVRLLLEGDPTEAARIAGELDRLTPVAHAERIDQGLPQSVGLYVSPTSGQSTPLECPELVEEALRDLAEVSGSGKLAARERELTA